MKIVIVVIVVFVTVGFTVSKIFLEAFGLEANYFLLALGSLAVTGLVAFRRLALVIPVCLLALFVSLPVELLAQYYLNRDILLGVLIMMVIFPLVYQQIAGRG